MGLEKLLLAPFKLLGKGLWLAAGAGFGGSLAAHGGLEAIVNGSLLSVVKGVPAAMFAYSTMYCIGGALVGMAAWYVGKMLWKGYRKLCGKEPSYSKAKWAVGTALSATTLVGAGAGAIALSRNSYFIKDALANAPGWGGEYLNAVTTSPYVLGGLLGALLLYRLGKLAFSKDYRTKVKAKAAPYFRRNQQANAAPQPTAPNRQTT